MTPRPRRSTPPNPRLVAALAYADKYGWKVFPLNGKQPWKGTHGYKDATTDPRRIRAWWKRWPSANVGIACDSTLGPIVVDIDGPTGTKFLKTLKLPRTRTATTGTVSKRHLYFTPTAGGCVIKRVIRPFGKDVALDILGDGGYVVAPPSVHPDGPVYAWVDPAAKILPLPPDVAAMLGGGVPEGMRNSELASHLGRVRAQGADEAQLLDAARSFNAKCDPPLSEAELRQTVKSILRYEPGVENPEQVMQELNAQFAVVLIGGKVRILDESTPQIALLGPDEFKLLFLNRFVRVGTKNQTIATYWLGHRERRQFKSVVFEPGKRHTPGAYNLWRGWGVTPKRGDCSLFLNHLREIVCGGDEKLYNWVLAWFADLFQHPRRKPGTSLVLVGEQGTGKTIVGKIIGKLIGRSYRLVASSRLMIGPFNRHLEDCLLLQADEAFWAGDQAGAGVLKDLITNDDQWIERKGIDAVEVRNYLRLLITSNSRWVVPAALEERRFCVVELSTARRQDTTYFAALQKQMKQGGYEALLYHLLHLNIKAVNLRAVPRTAALYRQVVATMTPLEAWYLDVLSRGYLAGDDGGTGRAPRRGLYDDYRQHAHDTGARRRTIETEVGQFLAKHVPGLKKADLTWPELGGVQPCYVFPSLKRCRAAFAKAIGKPDPWEKPYDWQPEPGRTLGARHAY